MTTWRERADTEAQHRYSINHYGLTGSRTHRTAFRHGTEWGIHQLATRQRIEAVARALCANDWPTQDGDSGDFDYHWEHFKHNYLTEARIAINALGEP